MFRYILGVFVLGGLLGIWVLRGHYGWIDYNWRRRISKVYDGFALLLPDKHRLYSVPYGKIYLNIKESIVILAQALGINEVDKAKLIQTFLKPGMTFVDVGANMGYFSLMAAGIVGDSGNVSAVEPEPSNCSWIQRSIEASGYQNIQVHELALGKADSSAQLFISPLSTLHTLMPNRLNDESEHIVVSQRTLDTLLADTNCSKVDMIKIDVEGAELDVLAGGAHTLAAYQDLILLIDIHTGVDTDKLYKLLSSFGFSMLNMRPPYKKLEQLEGVKECFVRRIP